MNTALRPLMSFADEVPSSQSQFLAPSLGLRPSHRRKTSQTSTHAEDDSPFITPRSPPFGPSRSIMNIFRGDGSVRTLWCCHIEVQSALNERIYIDARGHSNSDPSTAGNALG